MRFAEHVENRHSAYLRTRFSWKVMLFAWGGGGGGIDLVNRNKIQPVFKHLYFEAWERELLVIEVQHRAQDQACSNPAGAGVGTRLHPIPGLCHHQEAMEYSGICSHYGTYPWQRLLGPSRMTFKALQVNEWLLSELMWACPMITMLSHPYCCSQRIYYFTEVCLQVQVNYPLPLQN